MKLNDVDVVAGFSVRRQSQGFIRGRIESMQPPSQ